MRSCGTECVEQSLSLQLKAGGMRARRLLGVWNWPPVSEKHAFLLFQFPLCSESVETMGLVLSMAGWHKTLDNFENHAEPSGDDAIEAVAGRYHESDASLEFFGLVRHSQNRSTSCLTSR